MGYNSVVMLCNDAWGEIDKDPKGWWDATRHALSMIHKGQPVGYGFGNHANGFWAVRNSHADMHQVIVTGGNYATVLHNEFAGNRGHHEEEDEINLLRRMAEKHGYTLHKKRARKI